MSVVFLCVSASRFLKRLPGLLTFKRHSIQAVTLTLFTMGTASSAFSAAETFNGWKWLETTPTLHANFEQRTLGKSGAAIGPVAKGELWIQRPGRFRWRYDQPTAQLTVSDGKNVTWFDSQLKQMVVKPVQGSLTNALAQLLTAESASIQDRFHSTQDTKAEGHRLIVTPRQPDQEGFQKIVLTWKQQAAKNTLNDITVVDGLGQRILFQLSNVETPAQISADLFSFSPPAGTTVINEAAEKSKN